jgi:hypothetical protein
MPTEETDWNSPEARELPEDDLGISAHGLTGEDEWYEYLQKKTCRVRLDEAKGILSDPTRPHGPEEKQCLLEAADRLQSSVEDAVAKRRTGRVSVTKSNAKNLCPIADGSIHFICMDWRHMREVLDAASDSYNELKNLCVWTKTNAGMGSFYRSQHELVFVW